jgi:hypothetical protein
MLHQTLIQVDKYPDLNRDVYSRAIVNKNADALEAAKQQKSFVLGMKQKLEENGKELASLRGFLKIVADKLSIKLDK